MLAMQGLPIAWQMYQVPFLIFASLVLALLLYNYAGTRVAKHWPSFGRWVLLLPNAFAFEFVTTLTLKLLTSSLYVVYFFPVWFALGVYASLRRSKAEQTDDSSQY